MAKVKTGELVLDIDEALKFVRNAEGRVRCQVRVSAFLPTDDKMGFEGSTFIHVSRETMLKIIEDVGVNLCRKRGAKIKLRCDAEENPLYRGLCFISLY